jgi:hypothetical protein
VVCGAAANKKFVVAQLRDVNLSALFSLRGWSSVQPLFFLTSCFHDLQPPNLIAASFPPSYPYESARSASFWDGCPSLMNSKTKSLELPLLTLSIALLAIHPPPRLLALARQTSTATMYGDV